MGVIPWPTTGTLYCDSCILIYTVELHPQYSSFLDAMWKQLETKQVRIVTSELAILETLVTPFRNDDPRLIDEYDRFFKQPELEVVPITQDTLRKASQERAIYGLKTPDAIHLATALEGNCDYFITNDARLRGKSQIPIVVINEYIQP